MTARTARIVRGAFSRSLSISGAVALIVACTAIDPPAAFDDPGPPTDETRGNASAYERCRLLDRRFVTDVRARIYGDAANPQAVCVTLQLPVPAAGTGAVVFCVAGRLETVVVPSVRELTADLVKCAYCTDVRTNCIAPEAGASPTCATSYAVLTGRARIVRLGRAPGASVWIDIGDLEVARVTRRDEGRFDVERRDCLYADGLTLQGVLERGFAATCSGVEQTACDVANSASQRFP